jgi:hypothetical protein
VKSAVFAPPVLCSKIGVSSATFYMWKAKLRGLDVSNARRLKTLLSEELADIIGQSTRYPRLVNGRIAVSLGRRQPLFIPAFARRKDVVVQTRQAPRMRR